VRGVIGRMGAAMAGEIESRRVAVATEEMA